MISFKANLVNMATVQKLDIHKNATPYTVSFVELQPVSLNDKATLDAISPMWGGSEFSFAEDIKDDFDGIFKMNNPNKRFFALTKQKDHFEDLEPYDVLGLMEITQHTLKKYWLDYIQVSPEFDYFFKERKIKYIGKAMIDSLKKILPNKNIYLDAVSNVTKFYEKQGFDFINGMSMAFKPKL